MNPVDKTQASLRFVYNTINSLDAINEFHKRAYMNDVLKHAITVLRRLANEYENELDYIDNLERIPNE